MKIHQCLHQHSEKCIFSHIFFTQIRMFFSDKVNEILDEINLKENKYIKKIFKNNKIFQNRL